MILVNIGQTQQAIRVCPLEADNVRLETKKTDRKG